MREYGQIQCSFWQSADALAFSDAGKLLAAYLMTGPHSNGIGAYRLPDGYVMADLGWSSERVSEGFEELFRNGFAYRFEGVVCVPKFLFWNKVANANVAKARMAEFLALPKGDSKALAARAMLEFCGFLSDADRAQLETVSETVSKRYVKQDPTQPNQEQEPNQTKSAALRAASPTEVGALTLESPESEPEERGSRFAEFWTAYPNKTARKVCAAKWKSRKLDRLADEIIADVNRRASEDERWLNGYIPNPETYINQDRWNDPVQRQRQGASKQSSAADGPSPAAMRRLGS